MAIETKTIAEVPAIDALAADDEMLVRDTSKGESARVTMQELADFVGGGGGDVSTWSQYPATQDVDMDGHDVVGLPSYDPAVDPPPSDMSAAVSALTMNNAFNYLLPRWASYKASEDVDMDGHKITGLGAPSASDDAATKQYVDTVAGAAPTKIENGTSKVEIPSSGGDAVVTVSSQAIATFSFNNQTIIGSSFGGRLYLPADSGHSQIRSGGFTSNFTSVGYLQLPSGVTSYMHGIHLAKSAADGLASRDPVAWTPSWSGVLNVDSVSHVEASVQEIGDYIDVEGSLTVTPDAAGITVVAASIGVAFAHPAVDKDGQASAGVAGVSVQSAGCRVSTDGTVSVAFEAASNAEHTVSFRCRYRKVGT